MFKIPRISVVLLMGLFFAAILNMGTVRKKNSPVLKTQTDPIKLTDKMEEIKDGEKGPATPVFGWYGGNQFMVAPPFDKTKEEQPREELPNKISEVDLEEPESLAPKADKEGDVMAPPEFEESEESMEEPAEPAAEGHKEPDDTSKWEKDWWDET